MQRRKIHPTFLILEIIIKILKFYKKLKREFKDVGNITNIVLVIQDSLSTRQLIMQMHEESRYLQHFYFDSCRYVVQDIILMPLIDSNEVGFKGVS